MRPAGYRVVGSDKHPMLIQDKARAIEKAALLRGEVDALFTVQQIISALDGAGFDDEPAKEFIQNLGVVE